jgi:hypothetical protein
VLCIATIVLLADTQPFVTVRKTMSAYTQEDPR